MKRVLLKGSCNKKKVPSPVSWVKKKKKKIPACLICFCQKWPENLIINFFWPYIKTGPWDVGRLVCASTVHIFTSCERSLIQGSSLTINICLLSQRGLLLQERICSPNHWVKSLLEQLPTGEQIPTRFCFLQKHIYVSPLFGVVLYCTFSKHLY